MVNKTLTKKDKKDLDDIWKKKVKNRDKWICQVCGKKLEGRSCHAHHILPKQMKGMRWDVENGMTLCPSHHKLGIFSAHQNAIWFFGWMNINKKKQLRYCINKIAERGRLIK